MALKLPTDQTHRLIRIVAAAMAITLIGVALFLFAPGNVGLLPRDYIDRSEAYAVTNLQISGAYINITVPSGVLVPTFRSGKVSGCVVLGKGQFVIDFPASYASILSTELNATRIEDTITAAFVPGNYNTVEFLKASAGATPLPDSDVSEAEVFLTQRSSILKPVHFLGSGDFYFADQAASSFLMAGDSLGHVRYAEGNQLMIGIPSLKCSLTMPNVENRISPFFPVFAGRAMAVSTIVMSLAMVVLILALTWVATFDLTRLAPPLIPAQLRAGEGRVLAGITAALILRAMLVRRFGLGDWFETAFWVAGFIAVALILRWRRHHFSTLALDDHNLTRSLAAAALVGPLTVVAGSLSFPSGPLGLPGREIALRFVTSFIVTGCLREIVLRGYLQGTLSRFIGPRRAIFGTAFGLGLIQIVGNLLAGVHFSTVFFVEALLVIPVNSIILGYLYHRTSNLAGNMLAAGIIDFLPHVLKF